jgi:hypothetical protein
VSTFVALRVASTGLALLSITAFSVAQAPPLPLATSYGVASPSASYNDAVGHVDNMDLTLANEEGALHDYWRYADGDHPASFGWLNEEGGTPTACGIKQKEDAIGEAASYCSIDETIYLDISFLRFIDANYGTQGVNAVYAHEYGHHIEDDADVAGPGMTSRQLELQADFYAGAFMSQYEPNANMAVLEQQFRDVGDPAGTPWFVPRAHGTGQERVTAFENGYYHRPFNQGLAHILLPPLAAPAPAPPAKEVSG